MFGPLRHAAGAVVLVPRLVDGDLVLVGAGGRASYVPFQIGRRGSSVSWAWSQPGPPVAGAAHLELSDPGTLTKSGCSTGPPPPGPPPPLGGRIADRGVRLGRRRGGRSLSRSTARYSTQRALRQAGHVVEDPVRRVVVGAERRPAPSPTGRQANVTWLKPRAGTATPTSAPAADRAAEPRVCGQFSRRAPVGCRARADRRARRRPTARAR